VLGLSTGRGQYCSHFRSWALPKTWCKAILHPVRGRAQVGRWVQLFWASLQVHSPLDALQAASGVSLFQLLSQQQMPAPSVVPPSLAPPVLPPPPTADETARARAAEVAAAALDSKALLPEAVITLHIFKSMCQL
jgi:hypothetical protein